MNRKDRRTATGISNNNSAEAFLRQIGLTRSQEDEAMASCQQHFVRSAADLVLIYKRGELKDLFPQLGLHARIEAKMKQRSVALAKTCLLDTTASTISCDKSEDAADDADGKDIPTRSTDVDTTKQAKVRGVANSDNEIKLEKLVRDWFERSKRKAICFLNEHRCS